MIDGTRIKKKLDEEAFHHRLSLYNKDSIECTQHSFFRFSEKQRQTFTCDFAKNFLMNNKPVLAGLQNNGHYAVFYECKDDKFMKIIITFISDKIRVVTFYTIEKGQLPRL